MAVINGTQAAKGVSIIKSRGGITKMRCQKDQTNTISVPDGKGGFVEMCPTCKNRFVTTRI